MQKLLILAVLLLSFSLAAMAQKIALSNVNITYDFPGSNFYDIKSKTNQSIELERDGKVIEIGLITNVIGIENLPRKSITNKNQFVPVLLGTAYFLPDEALELPWGTATITFRVMINNMFAMPGSVEVGKSETIPETDLDDEYLYRGGIGVVYPISPLQTLSVFLTSNQFIQGFGTIPILGKVLNNVTLTGGAKSRRGSIR